MTYDFYLFAAASYVAFILLLSRFAAFNELEGDEDLALARQPWSRCAARISYQPGTHKRLRQYGTRALRRAALNTGAREGLRSEQLPD